MNVLIIHGPNLNLLGEAKGDPLSYAELNSRLEAFARELGVGVKIVQSNHEGVLVDCLQSERSWADAILINPAALTHTSYSLRECLRVVDRPTIEVHLEDIRRRETWRRKSVVKDVCEAQVMGKGLASYLDGLERLATGKYGGLRRGSKAVAAASRPPPSPQPRTSAPGMGSSVAAAAPSPAATPRPLPAKTIGRPAPAVDAGRLFRDAPNVLLPTLSKQPAKTIGRLAPAEPKKVDTLTKSGVNRATVREKIAFRLSKKITPAALATWAREQWLNVERGAATEMGQRELLEETLQTLALSATPSGHLTDQELIELMARL